MMDVRMFGKKARFHHIGLAVESIQAVCPSCQPFAEKSQGVSIGFIQLHGLTIELLEPFGENSPIAKSLRDGVRLLHICYEVSDLDLALETCVSLGFHRMSRIQRAPIFENRKFVWVYSKQYGLFELLEKHQGWWARLTRALVNLVRASSSVTDTATGTGLR